MKLFERISSMSKINSFIDYASDILGDTDKGISTSQIISICNRFAAEYNVNIPHTRIYQGFSQTFSNKRTALKENSAVSKKGAKYEEHLYLRTKTGPGSSSTYPTRYP